MKAKLLLSSILLTSTMLMNAQETTLHQADWKYKTGGIEQDTDKGKPTSDHSTYDLGGWESVTTSGNRPFYIAISKGAAIANTMEFVDASQESHYISWLISPAFDFSQNTDKHISLKAGLEKAENRTSNLELLYSTDYNGDVASANWHSIKKDLITDTQAGLAEAKLDSTGVTLSLITNEKVTLALKADRTDKAAGTGQAKMRVTKFKVTESAVSTSIENTTITTQTGVYPNPAKDVLNIIGAGSTAKIEIFALTGNKVLEVKYPSETVSIAHLSAGSYITQLTAIDGTVNTITVIKQ
ncbi:MAG: T9SS type A sorting domain-containing protein [Bacteroidales bacterium]